ncbi:MAG TPA: MipA/OmpV family protein [Gammaproteobacteria bacterium]|nr:MipA/OmpV family protein [Gammaproteobacteria bacterium]
MNRPFKTLLLALLFINIPFAWAGRLPVWEIHTGLAGMQLPHYRGSNSDSTLALPFPAIIYRGERLKIGDGRIQGFLYTSKTVTFDFSLAASLPASADDNGARRGMARLDPTFEIGPSLITRLWRSANKKTRLTLELPIRAAFSIDEDDLSPGDHGWTFAPFINIKHRDDHARWALSFGPIYATRRYHGYFYDVSTEDSLSARPAYSADEGYSGSRITLLIHKRFNKLSITGLLRYDILSNAVFMDSPLVERSNNLSTGLIIMWQIAKSTRSTDHTD